MEDGKETSKGSVLTGIGMAFLGHLFGQTFLGLVTGGGMAVFAIGVSQLIYMIPLWIAFRKSGNSETAKGLVIAAAVTALLNAACYGVIVWMLR